MGEGYPPLAAPKATRGWGGGEDEVRIVSESSYQKKGGPNESARHH